MDTTIKLGKTFSEIIQEEALKAGKSIDVSNIEVLNNYIDYIMWNHTGYPCFWSLKENETIEACFHRQIREFFSKTPEQIKTEEDDMVKRVKELTTEHKKALDGME